MDVALLAGMKEIASNSGQHIAVRLEDESVAVRTFLVRVVDGEVQVDN